MDEWVAHSKFNYCDLVLERINLENLFFDKDIAVNFLINTLACRSYLPHRAEFYLKLHEVITAQKDEEYATEFLRGLK